MTEPDTSASAERTTLAWTFDDPVGRPLLQHLFEDPPARPVTVTVVGAGGKTTNCHAISDEFASQGDRVLLTTTTKMGYEPGLLTSFEAVQAAIAPGQVVLGGAQYAPEKFRSFTDDELLALRSQVDALVIEGDGARRRPFKVPAEYEPVVPEWTDVLIVVVGLLSIGKTVERVCCRADVAAEMVGDQGILERPLTPELAARLTRLGFLENPKPSPWRQRRFVILNQADNAERMGYARAIAAELPGERILFASNRTAHNPEVTP